MIRPSICGKDIACAKDLRQAWACVGRTRKSACLEQSEWEMTWVWTLQNRVGHPKDFVFHSEGWEPCVDE